MFPFPPSSGSWWEACGDQISPSFRHASAWDPSSIPRPTGGFMSYFANQPHNLHLGGTPSNSVPVNTPISTNNDESSPLESEILPEQQPELGDSDGENVRTGKRILWTEEEDVRLPASSTKWTEKVHTKKSRSRS